MPGAKRWMPSCTSTGINFKENVVKMSCLSSFTHTVASVKAWLPVRTKSEMIANLKRNWYFPISAMAYFCFEFDVAVFFFVSLALVFSGMLIFASQTGNVAASAKGKPWYVHLFIVASGVGICWRGQSHSYPLWKSLSSLQAITQLLPFQIDLAMWVSVIGAVVAFAFVFISLNFFWSRMAAIVRDTKLFASASKCEIITCLGITILLIIGCSVIFLLTDAFYGTDALCDLIYTSDSPAHIQRNVFLSLTYYENDLRQPLFAVFSSPFMGLPYLLGRLLSLPHSIQAIITNAVQIMMLVFTNYLLTKILKLSPGKTVCFMVLLCCTYTQLLSVLMIEQYIVAYFWLVLCVFLIAEKHKPDPMVLWGAGNTLLTSMVLLPLVSNSSPVKNFKKWFADMLKYGFGFIGLMLLFGRFDLFYNLFAQLGLFSDFTGQNVLFRDKLLQFFEFIHNCILPPMTEIDTVTYDHISWQMTDVTAINIFGIVILLLAVISFIVNREKRCSQLAAFWIGFSVVVLVVFGWGTKENGLILYSLYFSWAYFALLFQLVEKIQSKLKIKFLIPVMTGLAVAAMLIINIPAMMEMVDFAITYYPL